MDPQEYARIAAAEDEHWWYRNARALLAELLQPWLAPDLRILDAGCGPGGNGAWLAEHGTVVGVDISPEALGFVRTRHTEVLPARATLEALPFPEQSFDVAIGVTVLYTVEDDARAVTELARVLRRGGVAALLEPAFDWARREHDTTVHGRRRYRRQGLTQLAHEAGLTVRRATYAYSFLAPPAAALGWLERVRRRSLSPSELKLELGSTSSPASDVERRSLDRVFAPLATLERRVLARRDVPIGTSVVILATRD
ncbi:MAG TPA: class I SAM-dependent methyltransferase [Acidimicrobiia bacterium]